jgi:probable HAF family extracellular repeat protein
MAGGGPVAATARVPADYRVVNLGGLSPNGVGEATALNDDGEVVGYSTAPNGYIHRFLWWNGVMTDLGALEPGGAEYGVAADINNRGEVVGSGDVAGGTAMHGFLWHDGMLTDLGTLGGMFNVAEAINDRGQVVGRSSTADGMWHAFVWENGLRPVLWQDGTVIDLTTRGITSGDMGHGAGVLRDVNNFGQIAGAYYFTYGQPGPALFV